MTLRSCLTLLSLVMSALAMSDPLDVVVTTEIISARDSKTNEPYVQTGNKVRVRSHVVVKARGYTSGSLREWLQERLPKSLEGYFEREEVATGLATRFKPITFQLEPESLHCTNDETSPEFRICRAEYKVSRTNTVDIAAGSGGEHRMSLQMLSPRELAFNLQMERGASIGYSVLTDKPKVSDYRFIGLPEQ